MTDMLDGQLDLDDTAAGIAPSTPPPADEVAAEPGPMPEPGSAASPKPDKAPATRKRTSSRKRTTPKRTAAGSTPKGGRPPKVVADRVALERQLVEAFGAIGLGLTMVGANSGNPAFVADGAAVLERSEQLAGALGALAEQNPTVMRVLSVATTGGAWFGVVAAFGGLGIAIAQNHGAIPGGDTPAQLAGLFAVTDDAAADGAGA